MSYILDALKRADTERERERGTVPGLHSQNLPGGQHQRERSRPSPRLPGYAAWVVLLVLAGVAGWAFWPDGEEPAQTTTAPQVTPQPPTSVTAQAPVAEQAAADAPAASAMTPPPQPPDLPILAPPPPAPPPPPPAARAARPAASEPASTDGSTTTAARAARPPASQAAETEVAPPAAARVLRFAELSPEVRAQLPQVNVSGSTYSSDPDLRTLIANGKVLQEGDEVAPGLQLERIGQRNAVLNFRGTRYSIGF